MLARRVIPCLDVDHGRVVKGVRFVDLTDAGDPVVLAQRYNDEGADELVYLDITASHEKRDIFLDVVTSTAEQVFIPLTVGGGVRTTGDVKQLLRAGADKVAINTAAVGEPNLVRATADEFGTQAIVVAIDARRREVSCGEVTWEVFVNGGRVPTGLDVLRWAGMVAELGAGELLVTSMDRDGTTDGYDVDLMRAITSAVDVPVIASGGAGTPDHLAEVVDDRGGRADAALAASVFHFARFSILDAKRAMAARGLPVRIPRP